MMKLFQRIDLKTYLLLSSKSLLRILRFTPKIYLLPSLIIYPSNICNFKCVMCDSGADQIKAAQRMDLRTLESLIRECSTYSLRPKIHFSGLGEPLVYSEIIRLMQLCKQTKSNWSMTTNGYLLETYAEALVANDCHAINISLHGTESEHDSVTGIQNSFKKVISGLQKLDKLKKNNHHRSPLIAVNCVITNKNVLKMKTILDHFIHLPVNSITFQHLIFSDGDFRQKEPFIVHEKESVESLKQFIVYVESNKFPLKINFFPKIKIHDLHNYYSIGNDKFKRSCILPWLSVRIYPNGDVGMCSIIYGSMLNYPLKSLINNDKAVMFRKALIKDEFKSSLCFRCCHRHYY